MIQSIGPDHYGLVAEWLSDKSLNRWLFSEWRGRRFDDRIVGALLMNKRNMAWLAFGKDAHGTLCPVGLIVLSEIDKIDRTALLWFLKGNSLAQARMSDAVSEVVSAAFGSLGLQSLSAFAMEGNHRSVRLLTRVGFKAVGRFRNGFFDDGRFVDRLAFDLLPKDLLA